MSPRPLAERHLSYDTIHHALHISLSILHTWRRIGWLPEAPLGDDPTATPAELRHALNRARIHASTWPPLRLVAAHLCTADHLERALAAYLHLAFPPPANGPDVITHTPAPPPTP